MEPLPDGWSLRPLVGGPRLLLLLFLTVFRRLTRRWPAAHNRLLLRGRRRADVDRLDGEGGTPAAVESMTGVLGPGRGSQVCGGRGDVSLI